MRIKNLFAPQSLRLTCTVSMTLLLITFGRAQMYWTWVNGPNSLNQTPVYGTQGTGSSTNTPGTRSGNQSWTDHNGNFWIFSSLGPGTTDLWKYDRSSNQWTWVRGSNVPGASGVYGTQGTANSSNDPHARYGGVTWVDASNNLWLFGGYNSTYGYLNDLWRYNISSNQWTWMKGGLNGSNLGGTYGSIGVPANSNTPGGRYYPTGWKDNSGNLWLFGGLGFPSNTNTGNLNDLWMYSVTNNQWTWVKGPNTSNSAGSWGTQGVAASGNIPSARARAVGWVSSGDLYLFGGDVAFQYNDLWKYNISSGNWTWVKGTSTGNALGTYGTQGTAAASNVPGSRYSPAAWIDGSGDLWMFGGVGQTGVSYNVLLSDMWKYNPSSNNWTWMAGPSGGNNGGTYGTLGVGAAANNPGSRVEPAAFGGGTMAIWMFAGAGYVTTTQGGLSDLWKYDACTVSAPSNSTAAANSTACAGSTTTLSAVNGTYTTQWFSSSSSTQVIGTGTNFITPPVGASGQITYYAGSFGCAPSSSRTAITITITSLPTITGNSGNLCTGNTYTIIPSGGINHTVTGGSFVVSPLSTTSYTVYGNNSAGCVGQTVVNITSLASPTLNISGTHSLICRNESSTLTITGANTYAWSSGDNGSIVVVNPTVTTTYSVIGTNSNGCVRNASFTVTVGSSSVNISATPTLVCDGQSATLTASGANTYSWSTNSSSPQIVVNPTIVTNYVVTGISSNGCTANASLTLIVDALPLAAVKNPEVLCNGGTATLTGYGASGYLWSGGGSSASMTVNPTSTTTYSLTGTSLNGCSKTLQLTLQVDNCPLTGLAEQTLPANIFPNPSKGEFTIRFNQPVSTTIRVHSISGTVIRDINMNSGEVTIDLTEVPAGVYVLSIIPSDGPIIRQKLLKD
jgi:hypothetical protein